MYGSETLAIVNQHSLAVFVVFALVVVVVVGTSLLATLAACGGIKWLFEDKYARLNEEYGALEAEETHAPPVGSEKMAEVAPVSETSTDHEASLANSKTPRREPETLQYVELFYFESVKQINGEHDRQLRFVARVHLRQGRVFIEPGNKYDYQLLVDEGIYGRMKEDPIGFVNSIIDDHPSHTYGAACGNVFAVPHYG